MLYRKEYDNGKRWALKVFNQKLKSGKLPRLGEGYPDEYRAAYAVSQIAKKKLGPDSPLWPKQKKFWEGVLEESTSLRSRYS